MKATLVAATLLLSVAASVTWGATFVVDSPLDEVDAVPGDGSCQTLSGTCTLRAGVQEANALAGADAIEVPAGTYVLSSLALDVRESLTVEGAGAADTIIDGNGATRVFQGGVGLTLTVSGVTIRNGVTVGNGGGVSSLHHVVVRDCVVTGNSASNLGGGIYASQLTLVRSTVEGNIAGFLGGGVAAVSGSIRDSCSRRACRSASSCPAGGCRCCRTACRSRRS